MNKGGKFIFWRIGGLFGWVRAISAAGCRGIPFAFEGYWKQDYGRLLCETAGAVPAVEARTYFDRNPVTFALLSSHRSIYFLQGACVLLDCNLGSR